MTVKYKERIKNKSLEGYTSKPKPTVAPITNVEESKPRSNKKRFTEQEYRIHLEALDLKEEEIQMILQHRYHKVTIGKDIPENV